MIDGFEKFGELYLKPEHIISVGFELTTDLGTTAGGIIGSVKKLKAAHIIFDNGVQLNVSGIEAEEFKAYWDACNASFGEVA